MTDSNDANNSNFTSETEMQNGDLTQFDDVFDEAPQEGNNDGDPPPDGKYQVNVEKVNLTTTKTSAQRVLRWSLRIVDPQQFAGRMLWHSNLIVTNDNIYWLKRDLITCGLRLARFSDLPAHLGSLLDIRLEVTKRTKGAYTNIYLNKRLADPLEGHGHGGSAPDDLPF